MGRIEPSEFDSSIVKNTPAGNIVATNVQTAINELDTKKVIKAGDTMSGSLIIGSITYDSRVDFGKIACAASPMVLINDPGGRLDIGSAPSTTYITITPDHILCPLQVSSAPIYTKGGMYFDLNLNKLRIGGATDWETVTSA